METLWEHAGRRADGLHPADSVVEVRHRTAEANGFDVHYVEAGEGPAMVLVHGDSASALDWSWVLPGLARTHRVLALDLPGNGDSAKPAAPYSTRLFADTLLAFLDAVGVERAVLVGHSMGGLAVVRAALAAPGRVEALCLVAGGGLGRWINPSMIAHTFPGIGEASLVLGPTVVGRTLRRTARPALLLARGGRRRRRGWTSRPDW